MTGHPRRLRATPVTIAAPMSPRRKLTHRPELDPRYVGDLRARVDALGFRRVAAAGRMGLASLWRVLAADADRSPTLDAIERVRAAVAKLDPDGPAVPPPFVAVAGEAHARWCALGATLDLDALAVAVADPARLRRAVIALRAPKRRAR